MEYVKLPPPRGSLLHEKLIAMVIATAFGASAVAAARSYDRPRPAAGRAVRSACDAHGSFASLSATTPVLDRDRQHPPR